MLKRWVFESLNTWMGVVMAVVTIALGLLAGLAASNVVHITDQQQVNIASVAAIGGAFGFFVYMFFVAPLRLWYKAEKELESRGDEKGAPVAVHHGRGNQFVFLNASDSQIERLARSAGTTPLGVDGYVPQSQTLQTRSPRVTRTDDLVPTPQLSLPLPPVPSELPRLEPEAFEEPQQ
jgi:hypothetical protein